MSRTPVSRLESNSNVTPRKSGPGSSAYGSRSFGDRQWPGSYSGSYSSDYRHRPPYDYRYGRPYAPRYPYYGSYGSYGSYGYRYPYYHRYPYYPRYGYYRPYYYRPYYVSAYPYFVPTFSFGLSYWDTPVYYSEPAVVYTQPTVVYTEPTPTYVESTTTYVQTEPTPVPVEGSTTYVERRYESQTAPAAPPAVGSPQQAQPPAPQEQPPAKQPDQRVLAAVGQGNEHFSAGRYGEARRAYGEAIAVDNTDGVAKLLFGLASFAEGDFSTAASTVRQGLDTTPDLIWYPFNVKALYRNDARFQEHISALASRVDADPANTEYQFLLGYMWYASGDAVSAKTIFTALATSNPSEQIYQAMRDASTQALESLSKQQAQAPGNQAAPVQPAPSQPNP